MYDDFARHRQASRRRTQFLMLTFALAAIIALVRLGYLQLLHAQAYRDEMKNWVNLSPEYLQPLRGDILDRNGAVLAQDAPCWQIEAFYQAFDPPLTRDGRSAYARRQADRLLEAAGVVPRRASQAQKQAAEQAALEAIANSWQKVADLAHIPPEQVHANAQQIIDRVRAIRASVATRLQLADDPRREPLVEEEREFHPILTDIPSNVANLIRQECPETLYPWLRVSISGTRQYADHPSIAPLLGHMRQVSRDDLDNDPYEGDDLLDLRPGDRIGSSGVENAAELLLRGRRGKLIGKKGSDPTVEAEPVRGRDVHLTIDIDLQKWIYERLAQAVRANVTASGASAVVLDVDTREILAAVSCPGYTHKQLADPEDAKRLLRDAIHRPTFLRAVAGQYEPGSIAKPITVLAALNSGVVGPHETIDCTGYLIPGQKGWRCWTVSHGMPPHGPVDAVAALQHSCNIYCVTAGQRVGIPRLTDWMRQFGMGAPAGTALREEQGHDGIVPTLAWYTSRHKTPSVADIRNFSIGEGEVQVTPIQAANISATIAAGVWRPVTLIRECPPAGHLAHRLPGSAEYLRLVREGMYKVVNDPSGTAYRYARIESHGQAAPIEIAGKTGTAESSYNAYAYGYDVTMHDGHVKTMEFASKQEAEEEFTRLGETVVSYKRTYTKWWPFPPGGEDKPTHAWFMGYAPYRAPRIAVAVIIEYGGGGAKVAGPVTRDIFRYCFGIEDSRNDQDDQTQG